ncbi:MAG: acyl-[acyl-carrier-protein]--UDP-N-acetylglucosamine O-acyltransferase, partial [Caulobacterales bacterium]
MAKIHPTAIVDASVEFGEDVEIGPGCIVGPHVKIGDRTRLIAQVYIETHTEIGADCTIYPFASLGAPPQDTSYKGEPTRVVIGDNNVFREHCSIHRGT